MTVPDRWAHLLGAIAAGPPADAAESSGRVREALELGHEIGTATIGASVTARSGDGFETPAASGPLALELDLAQYGSGSGPCMTAAVDGRPTSIEDTDASHDYPALRGPARGRGVRSVLSLPLLGTPTPAALNLYATTPRALTDPRFRVVATLLSRCVAALLGASADVTGPDCDEARARGEAVRRAVARTAAIEGVAEPAAFRSLARRSQSTCRPLAAVAAAVLATAESQENP